MSIGSEAQAEALIETNISESLTKQEYKRLLKQSCDRGFMLFLKSFIPLYHFRYWNTRLWQGAFIWLMLLSVWGANISNSAYEKKCRSDEDTCQAVKTSLQLTSGILWLSAQIVFGIYGGQKAKAARARLDLSRDLALKKYNEID